MITKLVTLNDLRLVLVECAGEVDGLDLADDIMDTEPETVRYDSLALMETSAQLQAELGVQLPDDAAVGLRAPRELLNLVNSALAEAS